MSLPLIITIGREYGSSGRQIGKKLASQLGIPFYDKEKLLSLAKTAPDYEEVKEFYEEKPVNDLLYAVEENWEGRSALAQKPFMRIRNLVGQEGGVIVGRCANVIFRKYENGLTVFIHAQDNIRISQIARMENISEHAAMKRMKEVDEGRSEFHNNYTGETWGAAKGYELCLDSGILGEDGCVQMILNYIKWKSKISD